MSSHRMPGRIVRSTAATCVAVLAVLAVPANAGAVVATVENGRIFYSDAALLPDPDTSLPSQVWSVNPDGTDVRQLTHVAEPAQAGGPDVAPNGKRVLYVSSVTGVFQVWSMRTDGTGQHRVVNDPGHDAFVPRWAPDGTHLLFTRCSTAFNFTECTIATANLDGSGLHDLTGGHWVDFSAAYSPDGSAITLSGDRDGFATALYRMPATGGALHRLTPAAPEYWWPDYHPDGSRLLFSDNADRPLSNLWTSRPDGTHRQQLTHLTEPDQNLAFARYAPDGRHIVADYLDNSTDWLVTMNLDGSGLTKVAQLGDDQHLALADWAVSS